MRAPWAAALLCALLTAPPAGAALFSSPKPPAVLWVPAESFRDWDALGQALERCASLKLTVGLTPELAEAARPALERFLSSGRLELSARLSGDPILPLAYARSSGLQPQRTVDRVAAAREALRGPGEPAAPPGFVPGAGLVSKDVLGALRAAGAGWVAAGPYGDVDAGWAHDGPLVLVPLRPADDGPVVDASAPGEPVVVDEGSGAAADGAFSRRLREIAADRRCPAWRTVSEAAASRPDGRREASQLEALPGWTGDASAWESSPAARASWSLYAAAAEALARYQNSGSADLKALDAANEDLSAAEAGRFYRGAGGPDGGVEPALRSRLAALYRRLGQPAPDALLAGGAVPDAPSDDGAVRVSRGEGWVQFDNPPGTTSRAPDSAQPLEDGTPAAALWRLSSLRVESGDVDTAFVFRLERLDPTAQGPIELGRVLLETYIDLNHRPGAGSATTLDGKAGAMLSRDGWEYALSVSAAGAFFIRANALGSPLVVGRPSVSVDQGRGEIRVSVPRSLLRGNPQRWGYVVAALALDPDTATKAPPRAQALPQGEVLGLLGSKDAQKRVFSSKARPRLEAVGADGPR